MKTMCLQCQRRPAAHDLGIGLTMKGKRVFCSLQCAAAWALLQVNGEISWCPDCSRWYLDVEGCTTCVRYSLAENPR